MQTAYLVFRFAKGAETVYKGHDEAKAREVYASEESAQIISCLGRDKNCEPIPGQMMTNTVLARKFHGVEQDISKQ